MAALTCEICGGRLIGKPGGIFECDSCGMEYSTEWAKAKIQEIKGTVKVEGTVEVKGTVKVDGPVTVDASGNAENLVKRGNLALGDKAWDKAKEFFNQALNIREENWEAYLGICMADKRCADRREFESFCIRNGIARNSNFRRMQELAPAEITEWILSLERRNREAIREREQKEQRRKDAEARIRDEAKARLEPIRKRIEPASTILSAGSHHTVGVTENGDAVFTGTIFCKKWRGVSALAAASSHTVALFRDGSVAVHLTSTGKPIHKKAESWTDIIKIVTSETFTVGLCEDGAVVSAGLGDDAEELSHWENIVDLAVGNGKVYGFAADGSVYSNKGKHSSWKDTVSVVAGSGFTARLTAYGKIVVNGVSDFSYNFCESDYVAIAAGRNHMLALRADGTVEAQHDGSAKAACDVSGWRDIVAIAAGEYHSVGLREDGTVLAAGKPWGIQDFQQCAVGGWRLFRDYDAFLKNHVPLKERKAHMRRERKKALEAEKAEIMEKLPTLKGILAGSKKKQMESRIAQIERELKNL